MNMLLTYLAAKGDALAFGVLIGAIIAILWLVPAPSRHDQPTRPSSSNRKSGRTRIDRGVR